MDNYSYDWTLRTAASVPSLKEVLGNWLTDVAKAVGAALPAHLKTDGLKVNPGAGPSYAGLTAKGYNRSDLETLVEIDFTVDNQPFRLRAFVSFKDPMMTKKSDQEFTLFYDDDVSKLIANINRWLNDL